MQWRCCVRVAGAEDVVDETGYGWEEPLVKVRHAQGADGSFPIKTTTHLST